MTLDEFLKRRGLSLNAIAAEAEKHLALVAGDCLFLAGSLLEGLGTPTSDIDLFLFTDRADFKFHSMTDIALVMGNSLIDIRVVTYDNVRSLAKRFLGWRSGPRFPRKAFEFSEDERKLMYRIAIGRALFGDEVLIALKADFKLPDLSRHKLDWARHLASATQVDIAGFLEADDRYSAFFATQELLGLTVDALLAGFGFCNPNTKWRARLLGSLESNWETHIPGRRMGLTAQDRYLELFSRMPTHDLKSVYLHALEVSAFSRAVFPWAEMRLLRRGKMPSPSSQSVSQSKEWAPARPLPPMKVDVEIRYTDDTLEVLRLNASGSALIFPPAAHAVLACFDGITDEREAACRILSEVGTDLADHVRSVNELASSIRFAGLEAPAPFDEDLLQRVLRS